MELVEKDLRVNKVLSILDYERAIIITNLSNKSDMLLLDMDDDVKERILNTWDMFSVDSVPLSIKSSINSRYIITVKFDDNNNFKTEISANRSLHSIRITLDNLLRYNIITCDF